MTTQEFLDWAFARDLPTEQKIILVALAWASGPDGGGSIKLGLLAQRTSLPTPAVLGFAGRLQSAGLIIIHYKPGPDDDLAEEDEIRFGLCIGGSAPPA